MTSPLEKYSGLLGLANLVPCLSQSEGLILLDIMDDHGLEQMMYFPTRDKNTLNRVYSFSYFKYGIYKPREVKKIR